MNPSWVNFYYVKPDLLIKLFEIEIELSGHITVLGAIALTVYKETSHRNCQSGRSLICRAMF